MISFHSSLPIYRDTRATVAALSYHATHLNLSLHESLLPTSLLPAMSPRLSPPPMRPLRPASLPPRSLRLMVSAALIHSIIATVMSPRRRPAPRSSEPTIRFRQSLARRRRRRADVLRFRRSPVSLTDELRRVPVDGVKAVWVVWVRRSRRREIRDRDSSSRGGEGFRVRGRRWCIPCRSNSRSITCDRDPRYVRTVGVEAC